MKRVPRPVLLSAALGALALVGIGLLAGAGQSRSGDAKNKVLAAAVDYKGPAINGKKKGGADTVGRLSSAPIIAASPTSAAASSSARGRSGGGSPAQPKTVGCQNRFAGGGQGGSNTRVNQDCSLRRQAEEVIAINPTNEDNLIAGQNDSIIGFNHCGYDYSFDGGKTWGSLVPPFYSYLIGGFRTADACSDPTATFDADGNAYIAGILFDIADAASALLVAKSNAGIGGAFYHSPAPGPTQLLTTDPGVVADNNFDENIFHDKEFIVADANKRSPKKNNVYVTWTVFNFATGAGVGGNSAIHFSQSTDGGATWSDPAEISGANPSICTDFSGSADPSACDQDQGSHPTVGSDGTVYVAFGNGNTPNFGENQVLFVKCPASADCSQAASWSAPVKVGDQVETTPFAGPGCPPGRQCIPPNGYRAPMVTSISTSIDASGTLYTSWADTRNLGANCLYTASTPAPPCDTDVFYAYSTDGGVSWSATKQVTPAGSAQWQPWSEVTPDGTLWIVYYDRSYGSCETTGCNDITAVKVQNPTSDKKDMQYTRVTTSSMPNLTPANNPVQAGFLGDYMWVDTDSKGRAYVVWADTRGKGNPGDPPEGDIYFAVVK